MSMRNGLEAVAPANVSANGATVRKRRRGKGVVTAPLPPPPTATAVETVERKFAIFGTTPSRMEGPIADGSGWKRLTIGPGGKDAHNWERLYEIHSWWPEDFKGYLSDLSQTKAPRQIVTLKPARELMRNWQRQHKKTDEEFRKDIPGDWSANLVLDQAALEEKYGRTWFSSSISWVFAHAIEEGATDIGMWGIDLESGEEYIAQYMGCRHFIDLARIVGINVHLPPGCALLREATAYPSRYETDFALHTQRKAEWLGQMLGQMEAEYEAKRGDLHRAEGWLLCLRAGGAPAEMIQAKEKELVDINRQVGQLAANINRLKGEQSATEYYRRMYVYQSRDPEWPGA